MVILRLTYAILKVKNKVLWNSIAFSKGQKKTETILENDMLN